MLPASLCAKIMVFRRITRIIEVVLNERAVGLFNISDKNAVIIQLNYVPLPQRLQSDSLSLVHY